MSAYTYIIGLAVLVTVLLTINTVPANGSIAYYGAADKSHNLSVGSRMPGDRLVLREDIEKKSGWLKVQTVEKTYNVSKYERITLVEAIDKQPDGNSAYASITNGGPGNSNVTMKFKSQRGHGIHFAVQIYSRP